VRKGLDSALKSRIQNELLTMDSDPEGAKVLKAFGARRFILTRTATTARSTITCGTANSTSPLTII